MRPSNSVDDVKNSYVVNPVLPRQSRFLSPCTSVLLAYLNYLRFSQLCTISLILFREYVVPSFADCVMHIGNIISKKEVFGSNTLRNVAFVADVDCARNVAKVKNPRNAGCRYCIPSPRLERTVPKRITTGNPQPAWTKFREAGWDWSVFVHFRPKAFWKCYRKPLRKIWVLYKSLTHRIQLPRAPYRGAEAFSF